MADNYNLYVKQFESNIRKTWKELHEEKDFSDVTLACDGKQILAHKIILCSGSSIFKNILKHNTNKHPIIYLNGVKSKDLEYLVRFIYEGELNIVEAELLNFLEVAKDLKIKGLSGEDEHSLNSSIKSSHNINANEKVSPAKVKHFESPVNATEDFNPPKKLLKLYEDKDLKDRNKQSDENLFHINKQETNEIDAHNLLLLEAEKPDTTLPIANNSSLMKIVVPGNNIDVLNDQLTCNICFQRFTAPFSLRRHKISRHEGIRFSCDQCSHKATDKWSLKVHINSIHKRLYLSCDKCDNSYTDRSTLKVHKRSVHEGIRYPCDKCEYKAKRKYYLKNHRCIEEED